MPNHTSQRYFIGGSDARIILGEDEGALLRLWREKRGEVEPEDLSNNLVVQLGRVTEDLNRRWYEVNTGQVVTDIQRQIRHPALRWMAANRAVLSVITGGGKWVEITTHAAFRVLRNRSANCAHEFDPLMSTMRTASIRGLGGSTPNSRGDSPLSTQRQNLRSAVTMRC